MRARGWAGNQPALERSIQYIAGQTRYEMVAVPQALRTWLLESTVKSPDGTGGKRRLQLMAIHAACVVPSAYFTSLNPSCAAYGAT